MPYPRFPKRQWSESECKEICDRYRSGETLTSLRQQFSTNKRAINKILHSGGVEKRTQAGILSGALRSEIGENARTWKGGRWVGKSGYVTVYKYCPSGRSEVKEHRLLMEQRLLAENPNHPALDGGKLSREWHVHHINGFPDDNRIENLEILPRKEHIARHRGEKRQLRLKIREQASRIAELESLVSELKEQSIYA